MHRVPTDHGALNSPTRLRESVGLGGEPAFGHQINRPVRLRRLIC